MKEILEELKESMGGIIGSFVSDENGEVISQDVPELMVSGIGKVSKTLHHVANVIKATKSVEKMTVDSDNAKVIVVSANGRMLVVIAEKNINQPLFKLIANMAVSKIKEADGGEVMPKATAATAKAQPASAAEIGRICDIYNQMYETTAKKLTMILGPKAGELFNEALEGIRNKYEKLFENVGFGETGKPEIAKLAANASRVTKAELIEGLEDFLVGMLEAVKSTAGTKVAEKTLVEINKIKEEHKGEI